MSDAINNVVILGAGQAGATVAFALRKQGFDGAITLVGDEVHLPYERPQLSKEMLLEADRPLRPIKPIDDYVSQSICLKLGRLAEAVDTEAGRVRLDDGQCLAYDRLVIATGTRPRLLPEVFGSLENVIALRTVEDAMTLRQRLIPGQSLVIVGGGVIGLEVAAAARRRGCPVTLVEAADRLMARSVDAWVSNVLDRTHRAAGVVIHYRTAVSCCDQQGRLTLSDGQVLQADHVLLGIGVEPNVRGLEGLGITDEFGVRVDACGRTAIETIFATGDVASQPLNGRFGRVETWANAQNHALAVATNLLGGTNRYNAPTWFWSDQGAMNIQVVGDARTGTAVIRGDVEGEAFSVFHLDDADHVTGAATVNAPKDMAVARRWASQGARVDRRKIADPSMALRDCAA